MTLNLEENGKIQGAPGETARIINIEFPGVCPYNLLCMSRSWDYQVKYHTDFRERMHVQDWGCVGGHSMKECSMFKVWKEKGYP